MQLAVQDFVAGGDDGVLDFAIERADFVVGERGGFFHLHEGVDEGVKLVQTHAGDVEILKSAQGLHTVVGISGDIAVAKQIVFFACTHGWFSC